MKSSDVLPNGKLPDGLLADLLRKLTRQPGTRVILGPQIGEDAGVIDMSHAVTDHDNCLVATIDPLSVSLPNLPYFAVACNVNDVATRGATPKWATASVKFPEGTTVGEVDKFFQELYFASLAFNLDIVSGHTEITSTVKSASIDLTVFGEVKKRDLVYTSGAQVGDALILAGGAGIEGTAILAMKSETLKSKNNSTPSTDLINRARKFLFYPGICVLAAAQVALNHKPNSMHDPTEGGVARGIIEVAGASNLGVAINRTAIIIHPETLELCELYSKDPLRIFGSGGLLVCVNRDIARALIDTLKSERIPSSIIGHMKRREYGCKIRNLDGIEEELVASHTDDLIVDIM